MNAVVARRQGRSNILQFLARALRSVDPPPHVTKRLTRETIDFLLSDGIKGRIGTQPLSWLLTSCDNSLSSVDNELFRIIDELIRSESAEVHEDGLFLLLLLDDFAWNDGNGARLRGFWRQRIDESIRVHADSIGTSAESNIVIRIIALNEMAITVDQALRMTGGLQPLLKTRFIDSIGFGYGAYLLHRFWTMAHGVPEFDETYIIKANNELTSAGRHIISNPCPPWTAGPVDDSGPIRLAEPHQSYRTVNLD